MTSDKAKEKRKDGRKERRKGERGGGGGREEGKEGERKTIKKKVNVIICTFHNFVPKSSLIMKQRREIALVFHLTFYVPSLYFSLLLYFQ